MLTTVYQEACVPRTLYVCPDHKSYQCGQDLDQQSPQGIKDIGDQQGQNGGAVLIC